MNRTFCASMLALAFCATVVIAGDLKSGPQPGKGVAAFHPLNIYNADIPARNGKEGCFV